MKIGFLLDIFKSLSVSESVTCFTRIPNKITYSTSDLQHFLSFWDMFDISIFLCRLWSCPHNALVLHCPRPDLAPGGWAGRDRPQCGHRHRDPRRQSRYLRGEYTHTFTFIKFIQFKLDQLQPPVASPSWCSYKNVHCATNPAIIIESSHLQWIQPYSMNPAILNESSHLKIQQSSIKPAILNESSHPQWIQQSSIKPAILIEYSHPQWIKQSSMNPAPLNEFSHPSMNPATTQWIQQPLNDSCRPKKNTVQYVSLRYGIH